MQQFPSQHAQSILPDQYLWLRSDNLDEARDTISNAYDSHRLEPLGQQQDVGVSLHVALLNSVTFSLIHYSSDMVATINEGSGIYVLMPLSGQLEIISDGQRRQCLPGSAIVQNAGVGFQKVMSNGYKQLVIKFDPETVMQFLGQSLGQAPAEQIHFESVLDATSTHGASWWRTVNYVMEELRNADSRDSTQLVNEPLERLLIQNILRCQPHNYSQALAAPKTFQISPWYIKKAEEYLHTYFDENVTLEHLAEATGVSSRSLQYGFKKAHGLTPIQYLKALRLERVHSELLRGSIGASVTSVAMACGFKQLGWFSSQYKDKYGEAPSETLRRVIAGKSLQ